MTDPKTRLAKIEKQRGVIKEPPAIIVVWEDEDLDGDTITLEDGTTMTRAEYLRAHPEDLETIVITWPDD